MRLFSRAFLGFAALSLSACAVQPHPLSTAEQQALLTADLTQISVDAPSFEKPITLYEAFGRALKFNTTFRMAQMEKKLADKDADLALFGFLPNMSVSAGYRDRDDPSASSSRSYATGRESLESSVSQENVRYTGSLEASWSMLDFGMSWLRARQTANELLIREERRRKSIQTVLADVRDAFWRTVAAQRSTGKIDRLIKEADAALKKVKAAKEAGLENPMESLVFQRNLLTTVNELKALRQNLALAKMDLALLLHIPPGTDFSVDAGTKNGKSDPVPRIDAPLAELETAALFARPEIKEEMYRSRLAADDIRQTLIALFPNMSAAVSGQYDSNAYTLHNSWVQMSVDLTQDLVGLLKAPHRLAKSKTIEEIAALRRQGMALSVLSQVHIAAQQYRLEKDRFASLKRLTNVNRQIVQKAKSNLEAKTGRDVDLVRTKAEMLINNTRLQMAYARLQNSYGRVLVTLGVDPAEDLDLSHPVKDLAKAMAGRYDSVKTAVTSQSLARLTKEAQNPAPGKARPAKGLREIVQTQGVAALLDRRQDK